MSKYFCIHSYLLVLLSNCSLKIVFLKTLKASCSVASTVFLRNPISLSLNVTSFPWLWNCYYRFPLIGFLKFYQHISMSVFFCFELNCLFHSEHQNNFCCCCYFLNYFLSLFCYIVSYASYI